MEKIEEKNIDNMTDDEIMKEIFIKVIEINVRINDLLNNVSEDSRW